MFRWLEGCESRSELAIKSAPFSFAARAVEAGTAANFMDEVATKTKARSAGTRNYKGNCCHSRVLGMTMVANPMASSPYLESPVQASMGTVSETQMENETWSKPKVKAPKAEKTPQAQGKGRTG